MTPLKRALCVCAPLAATVLLAMTGTSYGSAPTCDPDHNACAFSSDSGPQAFTRPADPIDCLGPAPGAVTGTAEDTEAVTFSNMDTNRFFHLRTTHSESGRMDFPYGSVVYRLDEQFNYNSGSHPPALTLSSPVNAQGTVYGPDGVPTGQHVSLHALMHFTWTDTNGDADPDPGDDYHASVSRFSVTCN